MLYLFIHSIELDSSLFLKTTFGFQCGPRHSGHKGAGAQPFDHVSTGPCFNFARIGQSRACPRPEPSYTNIRL